MRCFLGLRPDADGCDQLETITRPLRQWQLPARWVHTQDFHLTLCFLGEVDDADIMGVRYSVEEVAGSMPRPSLRLDGLGAFGGKSHPKVLYAAADDPGGACEAYHRDLCEVLGVRPSRHFQPHFTLCRPQRVPEHSPRDWPDLITAFGAADWGPIGVAEMVLYESRPPSNGGPRYHGLASWPLLS